MRKLNNMTVACYSIIALFAVILACKADADIKRINSNLEAVRALNEQIKAENDMLRAELSVLNNEMNSRFDEMEHWQEVTDIRLKNHYGEITDSKGKIEKIEKQKASAAVFTSSKGGRVNVSQADVYLIARLVYLECGSSSYRCQQAVASVVINRMRRYGKTARQVIYEDGVFSVAYKVSRTTPSSSSLRAVRSVINNGVILPRNVVAFRNNRYHSFGRPYCRIDNVYFSRM